MTTYQAAARRETDATRKPGGIRRVVRKLLRDGQRIIFHEWPERRRQRLDLSELTDERLRDLGISRTSRGRECRKLFWQ